MLAPATVIVALVAIGLAAAPAGPRAGMAGRPARTGAAAASRRCCSPLPGIVTLSGVERAGGVAVRAALRAGRGGRPGSPAWQVAGLSARACCTRTPAATPPTTGGRSPSWAGGPATGDFGPVAADDEFGIYRGNGSRRQRDDLDYRGTAGYDAQQPSYPGGPADTGFRDGYPNEAGHLDDGPLYRDEAAYPDESGYSGDLGVPGRAREPRTNGRRTGMRPATRDEAGYPGEHDYAGTARPAATDRDAQADLFGQIAIYTLLEDRVEDFDRLTRRVVRQVRAHEPDTLVYIVHAVPSAPMQRILYEVYRDRSAYEEHKRQPYVIAFEADRRPFVLATNIIELGLQQAKVSPLPSVSDLLSDTGFDLLSDSGFGQPGYGPRPGSSRGGVAAVMDSSGETRQAHVITLLTRPGCHLCDDARAVIARVAADLGVSWQERDITRSESDLRAYGEMIPVTLIDGVQHDFWRVSEQRLRAALSACSQAAGPGTGH